MALVADNMHAVALRQYSHYQDGSSLLRMATTLNPLDMNARLSQVEILLNTYRKGRNDFHLKEAELIAKSIVKDFPFNSQALMAYATTESICAAHSDCSPQRAFIACEKAYESDRTSLYNIERYMFTLAVFRVDRMKFLELGVKRASLTNKSLVMFCEICGKHWLEHKR
jgi:hypothetical protein